MKLYLSVLVLLGALLGAPQDAARAQDQAVRTLSFPPDCSVGPLVDLSAPKFADVHSGWWLGLQGAQFKELGDAKGARSFPKTTPLGLTISVNECATPEVLDALPPDSLASLVVPHVRETRLFSDPWIERAARMTSLKTLLLDRPCNSGNSLAPLQRLQELEYLGVTLPALDSFALDTIASFKSLKGLSLALKEEAPSSEIMAKLANMQGLHEIFFRELTPGPEALAKLAALPSLEVLYLGGGNLGGAGLEALPRFASLRRLEFYDLTDEGLRGLPPIPSLRELHIQGKHAGFSPEALAALGRQTSLETLSLRARYSDDAIAQLKGLQSLRQLGLHAGLQDSAPIGDASLAHIGQLKSLESLDILTGRFSDGSLKCLAGLPQLKCLNIPNNSFTDVGLQEIAKYPALVELRIRADKITDDGIQCLANLASLRKLTLMFNRSISDTALATLRGKLAGLETFCEPTSMRGK